MPGHPDRDRRPTTVRASPTTRLPHVFERFWQGHAATGTGGSGIGLAVVAELVRAHGGVVYATNVEGRGARFTVQLPRR